MSCGRGRAQAAQDQAQPFGLLWLDTGLRSGLEEFGQPLMPEAADHSDQCNLRRYGSQDRPTCNSPELGSAVDAARPCRVARLAPAGRAWISAGVSRTWLAGLASRAVSTQTRDIRWISRCPTRLGPVGSLAEDAVGGTRDAGRAAVEDVGAPRAPCARRRRARSGACAGRRSRSP